MKQDNWEKVMFFSRSNRRRATPEEAIHLSKYLPPEYRMQISRDVVIYPLFDWAAMAIHYWAPKEFDCTEFADEVVKILS